MPDPAVHRRWVLSKRAEDGRPLIVREDRVVHPKRFAARARGAVAMEAAEAEGTPALH
ncbi:MAG TPA: hypothetical protein VMF14_13115 [Solirubrobacteraceae bacterium]|nr:hypothetical protein [Solirubrobacteraceae bacterium]